MTKSELAKILNVPESCLSYKNDRWDVNLYYENQTNDYPKLTISEKLIKNGKLIVNFGHIKGGFDISECGLETLEGCPITITRFFNCSNNRLKSLKYCPLYVGDSFECLNNNIKSLEDLKDMIGKISLNVSYNELTNLIGLPPVMGSLKCSNNQITNLYGVPKIIYGIFDCSHNLLTDISNIPLKIYHHFDCSHNLFINLTNNMLQVNIKVICDNNPHLKSIDLSNDANDINSDSNSYCTIYSRNNNNISIPNKLNFKAIILGNNKNIKFLNKHNNYNLYRTNYIKFVKYPYDKCN